MIDRWAGVVASRARTVVVVGLLVTLAAAAYGLGIFGSLQQGGFDTPGSETNQQQEVEREVFGNQTADVIVVYSDDVLVADDEEFKTAVADVVSSLPGDAVTHVRAYYDTPEDPGLVSEDRHHAQVVISLAGKSQGEQLDAYDRVKPLLRADGLETDITGFYPVYSDIHHQTSADLTRAELLSLPLVLVLALLIFGSAVSALMPAMVGGIAMAGSLGFVRLLTNVTDVSIFVVNVVSLLGIGLAIDYALFIVTRFREELAELPEGDPSAPVRAVRRTLATAGRTVLFSGLTVAAALSTLLIFPQMFFRSMAYGGVAAVIIAMVSAITILPAILVLCGPRIDAGRMPWRRGRPVLGASDHGRWAALSRLVMRRPAAVLALTTIVMVVIASPFLGVKWASFDHTSLPSSAPSRIGDEKLAAEFGGAKSTANVVLSGVDQDAVGAYVADARRLGTGVTADVQDQSGDNALVRVTWPGNTQDEASRDLVRELRTIKPATGEALVGGITADTVDLLDSVGARLPWMALSVAVVMFVLLFVAFGSLVLPIKAIVMNAFSLAACFGVVTWIFNDGHLSGLLAFDPQGYLDATNSILMLAIVFGLSMDYEVFLLSRVREAWDATGDNVVAVATGMQKTGRTITCAALLLGAVVGAFSTGGVIVLKMLGIGMLIALLLDATLVRALMVPATMRLLGRLNWWAPAPLANWWRKHRPREHETRPHVGKHASTPVG